MPLPSELYQQKVQNGSLTEDQKQLGILPVLDDVANKIGNGEKAQGVFLCGEVGRGKSMLMQLLFDAVTRVKKRRVHFHPFMEEMHHRMHTTKPIGGKDIIQTIAEEIKQDAELLCFDEFYVTNIGDAVLLGRLLEAFFKCGITLCATSNWRIEDLYQDGHNRSLFQPFIKIIQHHLTEVVLASEHDWRRKNSSEGKGFEMPQTHNPYLVKLLDTEIPFEHYAGGVGIVSFKNICDTFIGRSEYMALCEKLDKLVITDVPYLDKTLADAAMRFVILVDLLYENGVALEVTTAEDLEHICEEGPVAFAFQRTLSRMAELRNS